MSCSTSRPNRGQLASLACLYEVAAPKPGNVHRGADFEDMTFFDFAASAIAIAPPMNAATKQPVGQTILHAIRATQEAVGKNTNLGIVLLTSPLAAVPDEIALRDGIATVLGGLTAQDASDVYDAIRLAAPGGMGSTKEQDINDAAPDDLLEAMRLAEHRDHVAYQYTHNFETVFDHVLPDLVNGAGQHSLSDAIVHAHVLQMARTPDTLIRRKCGDDIAQQSADRAAAVVSGGSVGSHEYVKALAALDFWLRSDGHRRNPGTTADLIAAGLFVGLREGTIDTSPKR